MKEYPIPFKAAMVRAVLDGSKTQTRRICKNQPYGNGFAFDGGDYLCHNDYLPPSAMLMDVRSGKHSYTTSNLEGWEAECPYGVPGDRLWVREAFRFPASLDRRSPKVVGDMALDAGYSTPWAPTQYDADGARKGEWRGFETPPKESVPGKYRPPMFMPRWASRITLEVVSVRVVRLQDISRADARAEGAPPSHPSIDKVSREFGYEDFSRSWYAQLWDEINGAGAWAANPWVWAVEFRRLP